jgi:hypothetical protein
MTWQQKLKNFEKRKEWDIAIELMQHMVANNPHDLDIYLSTLYLLMNLLVEEDYEDSKHSYYAYLTKKYFDESYEKFSTDPEYLFYVGRIAVMSEWFFEIDVKDYEKMLLDAIRIAPDNPLYQWSYYDILPRDTPDNRKRICAYAAMVLKENSPIKTLLISKGSLGEYLLGLITNWSIGVLKIDSLYPSVTI